jgi:biotin synthase
MRDTITTFLDRAASGRALSAGEAASLLPSLSDHLGDVLALARLSASAGGASPFLCGIINAKSGRCSEDCAFCAQAARHDTGAPEYAMVDGLSLLRRAEALAGSGARYMGVVFSGVSPDKADFERLCEDARRIVARVPIRLCASVGIVSEDQARVLKQAGFSSCHHNLESAPSHYGAICRSHGIERRIETARNARKAGLRLCCGGIFGLGESWEQRLELSALLAELDVDSIPVNFLTPIPGTPLAGRSMLPPGEALGVVALLRLMHPARDIVICGGRTAVLGEWDRLLFSAGANAMMTGDYLTTSGSAVDRDRAMLAALGIRI